MPNLVICLTFVRFVLFGPRDPPQYCYFISLPIEFKDPFERKKTDSVNGIMFPAIVILYPRITGIVQRSKKNLKKTIDLSSASTTANKFQRFFTVHFDPTPTLQVNQYALINSIEELTGEPPTLIVTNGKTAFTVKYASENQANKLSSLNKAGNLPCKTSLYSLY